MSSPLIAKVTGNSSACLQGKAAVRRYWEQALRSLPELEMEAINTLAGVNTLVINYHGPGGLSAEFFFFNDKNQVVKPAAHYL